MRTLLRRMVVLLLIGAGGATAVRVARRRRATIAHPLTSVAPETSWPPFEAQDVPVETGAVGKLATAADEATADAHGWLATVDGRCPDGHLIKANVSSRIYHLPGGRFYERTIPDRCYATTDAAERDGYRRAKA